MLQTTPPADTRIITLCNVHGPVGTCRLVDNQFVIQADDIQQQDELARLVQAKYRLLAQFAREDEKKLTKEDFFLDMPHHVRGIMFYATRPLTFDDELLPEGLKKLYAVAFQARKASKE